MLLRSLKTPTAVLLRGGLSSMILVISIITKSASAVD